MAEITVEIQELQVRLFCLYENSGLSKEEIELLIDTLIDAELRGVKTHGIVRTLPYYHRVLEGGIRTETQMTAVRDHQAVSVYDGNHGLGQWIAYKAMETAIKKARKFGISAVSVKNNQHFGTAGYFAKMAADEDMIGLVFTNASPRLAPWGGKDPLFGNNPWAIAVPTARREVPFVLDIANSVTAAGRIRNAKKKGENIPLGWAMNENGELTTDPSEALKGILLPLGQHKGYGITFAVSILSSFLSGGIPDTEVNSIDQTDTAQGVSHFFTAIHIDAFQPILEFKERMEELIAEVHTSGKFPNTDTLYYPGERGYSQKNKALESNVISIDQNVWEELNQFCRQLSKP